MELPNIGKHCAEPTCNKLDFLPIKCDVCSKTFCNEHYSYLKHNCEKAYKKDNQVPVCPLCNKPIPVPPGQEPDRVVGAHIDDDCQSDPARDKRRVFTNRCSRKGCKIKEVVPVLCGECGQNHCLKHRHPQDHQCQGKKAAARQKALLESEDEALARALALSMQETSKHSQADYDEALARQLQQSEYQKGATASTSRNKDKCSVI